MYELSDTIVAVSSPSSGPREIVRVSGPETVGICKQIFSQPIIRTQSGLMVGSIIIDDGLKVDAILYLFWAPRSYTGDDVVEIHLFANHIVTGELYKNLLTKGLRPAGPGEFTARAYLNGKIDLAQAEAVNEVVVSSNAFQLAAAQKLLSGKLSETTAKALSAMMDCLSLIEAGLDFSGEDIELVTRQEAVERLEVIKEQLEQLLSGSQRFESVVDLPAVGIAGAPNAGKSSLLNKLLGQERSIVSDERKTTRDVLTGLLTLSHCRCVLFDCAGLTRCSILDTRYSILDELAQGAAIEALQNASVVLFCVDTSKEDWSEDVSIRQLIEPKVLIPVATKCDLLPVKILAGQLAKLNKLFGTEFLAISVKNGGGIEQLRQVIDEKIIEMAFGSGAKGGGRRFSEGGQEAIGLTIRHRQAVSEAIGNIDEAINEVKADNDEVAAVEIRAAYQAICDIGQPVEGRIDDQILERIFGRFCIGK
jgi:tRNA modification GTPase